MEYPKLGEERYRSGRDKYYCAFHKVALQIQETPWQMPAYQNLIIQEEEIGSSTVSKRVLYSEADIQAHFETLLDSILHKDGRFGASAPVEISRAENYWTSDSGESFAHFFANTRPDSVTQLLGRKLIVVEVKTPWPPLHRLSGLSCELRARLFGQLVRQQSAYRTKFGIVTTLEQTVFCQLVCRNEESNDPDDWELQVSEVIEWGESGGNISKHLKAFLSWVDGQDADLKAAYSSWVVPCLTAKQPTPKPGNAKQHEPAVKVVSGKRKHDDEADPAVHRSSQRQDLTIFRSKRGFKKISDDIDMEMSE